MTDRWAEYFEKFLNRQSNDEREMQFNNNDYEVNEENRVPPTVDEIRDAIAKLRNERTPGEDLISAEFLKYGGEKLIQMLYDLIVENWQNENMPNKWNSAITIPILKKANILNYQYFRGIALLKVTYKVLTKIIAKRL